MCGGNASSCCRGQGSQTDAVISSGCQRIMRAICKWQSLTPFQLLMSTVLPAQVLHIRNLPYETTHEVRAGSLAATAWLLNIDKKVCSTS